MPSISRFSTRAKFGYIADAHTGAYYCTHRFYDPNTGRWLSRDPVGLEGGTNTYSYCEGNPVMYVDPSGLEWTIFGFEFSSEVWGNGLRTGIGGVGHVTAPLILVGSHYTDKGAESQLGYSESIWLAERGVDAAEMAVGEGIFVKAGQFLLKGKTAYQAYKVGRTMANVRRVGLIGERTVSAAVNIGPKTRYIINGRIRIADGINKALHTYSEVKNVAKLAKTQQIVDGIEHARMNNLTYNLFIRRGAGTTLTGPLVLLEKTGQIIVHRIL